LRVLGVVGLNGSGKDEVVRYLHQSHGVPTLSLGDMVRQIALERGVNPTRSNLHRLSQEYFAERGRDYFARKAILAIDDHDWDLVGITGIRTPTDVKTMREHFGNHFVLAHVAVSDSKKRYERVRERGEARDPQSYSEFLQQDAKEEEIFHLSETAREADIVLDNDQSVIKLHSQIDRKVVPELQRDDP
jgi:dephospho-CoA kinase